MIYIIECSIKVNTQYILYRVVYTPIAFGPVDIGSMNAHEATRVAGSMKKRGFTCHFFSLFFLIFLCFFLLFFLFLFSIFCFIVSVAGSTKKRMGTCHFFSLDFLFSIFCFSFFLFRFLFSIICFKFSVDCPTQLILFLIVCF